MTDELEIIKLLVQELRDERIAKLENSRRLMMIVEQISREAIPILQKFNQPTPTSTQPVPTYPIHPPSNC